MNNFNKRIKKLRHSLMLSQREFAKLIGLTQTSICHLEKSVKNPSFATQRKVADLIKKHGLEDLINDEEESDESQGSQTITSRGITENHGEGLCRGA